MPAICALAVGDWSFDRCNDGVIHMGIFTPQKHYHMHQHVGVALTDFDMRMLKPHSSQGEVVMFCANMLQRLGCLTRPDVTSVQRLVHEHRGFFRCFFSLSFSVSAPHVWILSQWPGFPEISGSFKQTTTGGKTQLLSLPQRQGQPVEKWEWGLEFNYSLKALRVQYEREGWDINLLGCLCLYGGYNKKIIQNPLRRHWSLWRGGSKFDKWTTGLSKADVHSFFQLSLIKVSIFALSCKATLQ